MNININELTKRLSEELTYRRWRSINGDKNDIVRYKAVCDFVVTLGFGIRERGNYVVEVFEASFSREFN